MSLSFNLLQISVTILKLIFFLQLKNSTKFTNTTASWKGGGYFLLTTSSFLGALFTIHAMIHFLFSSSPKQE
jgi:hypothetical protein